MELVRHGELHTCTMRAIDESIDESDFDAAVGDFRVEVIDQVLRERIREQTQGARDLVLSMAFSAAAVGVTEATHAADPVTS